MLIRSEQEIEDDELRVEVNLRGGQMIALTLSLADTDRMRDVIVARWNGSRAAAETPTIALGGNTVVRADAIDSMTTYSAETWNARVRASNDQWMRRA